MRVGIGFGTPMVPCIILAWGRFGNRLPISASTWPSQPPSQALLPVSSVPFYFTSPWFSLFPLKPWSPMLVFTSKIGIVIAFWKEKGGGVHGWTEVEESTGNGFINSLYHSSTFSMHIRIYFLYYVYLLVICTEQIASSNLFSASFCLKSGKPWFKSFL